MEAGKVRVVLYKDEWWPVFGLEVLKEGEMRFGEERWVGADLVARWEAASAALQAVSNEIRALWEDDP